MVATGPRRADRIAPMKTISVAHMLPLLAASAVFMTVLVAATM